MSPRDRNKLVVGIPTLLILAALILGPATVRYIEAQTQPIGVTPTIFRGAAGTLAAPTYSFGTGTGTGFYLSSSGVVCYAFNGTAGPCFNGTTFGATSGGNLVAINLHSTGAVGISGIASGSMTLSNGGTGATGVQIAGTSTVLAIPAGGLGFATASTASVGNTGQGGRLVVVCGPTAGTGSLLFYAGTTNVPVTLANAVGGGLIGC